MIRIQRKAQQAIPTAVALEPRGMRGKISAYDLAREIAQEIVETSAPVFEAVFDADDEIDSVEVTNDGVLLIERMIRDALRNGGIAQ